MNEELKRTLNKIIKAKEKFIFFIDNYAAREDLKILATKTGVEDFKILSHWLRSIVSSDYDLEHPDYLEYKKHYNIGDVDWLEKGRTYVKIDKYKKYKGGSII